MRAATLVASGVIEVQEVPVPEPAPGQVVVRMHYASICGSDLHVIFDGFHTEARLGLPGYPGHEGVGVVVDGADSGLGPGTPVLTVPFGRLGGCFADYQLVPTSQLIELPAGADLRRLLLAQQLGTTVFAMKKFLPAAAPVPATVVVIGAGSAGLFFLQQLRRRGAEVLITDLEPARLDVARSLGAAEAVLEPGESIVTATLDHTDGRGADLVIEAAGGEVARAMAVDVAAVGATVGGFGYPERAGGEHYPIDRAFRKSLTVVFTNHTQGEPGLSSFRSAAEMIMNGEIEVDYCLQAMYDLEETPTAVQAARARGRGAAKVGLILPAARQHQ